MRRSKHIFFGKTLWPIAIGLVAAYNLDNNTTDIINGYNGTASNVTFVSGLINQAGLFNSTGSILIPNNSDFNFGNSDFAINMQIKRDASLPNIEAFMGKAGTIGGPSDTEFVMLFISDTLYAGISNGTSFYFATSAATITNTNYHNVCMQRNGNTLQLYVDNVLSGTANVTGVTIPAMSGSVGIGSQGDFSTTAPFTGQIDIVRIYKGRSLLTSEINYYYNGGLGNQNL